MTAQAHSPLRVALVDDEPLARLRMQQLLAQASVPTLVVGAWGDAQSAVQGVQQLLPPGALARPPGLDVVFLDIAMPGLHGMALAQRLLAAHPSLLIVFVTAHPEHALSAFDLNALDYLTKPVRLARLEASLARALARLKRSSSPEDVQPGPGPDGQEPHALDDVLVVHERGGVTRVPVADVLYLRAEHKYVTLRTPQHTYTLDDSLLDLEARLGERFVRVHRNALVAGRAMMRLERRIEADGLEAWWVQVSPTGEWLAVSRRQLGAVKTKMANPL